MLGDIQYTINELFAQLGLDDSDEFIAEFVKQNQLDKDTLLSDAPFWSEKQRMFIKDEWRRDAMWSLAIDDLNERLHKDAV